jgi:hypothetical protein
MRKQTLVHTFNTGLLLIALLFGPMQFCLAQKGTKIAKTDLPALAQEHLAKKYTTHGMTNILQTTDGQGVMTYTLEARKEKAGSGGKTIMTINYLTFDANGKQIDKRVEREEYFDGTPPPKTPTTIHKPGDGHKH